ncbi:NUDIX hydrolase [Demequina muriae]|uniref:NUDIX hydrolase n=1 Tax=Demequina muriae TaxID=3051664 RepID=A0ABT8GK01_9MICO|nr:NUDIX hydrolase [Demequina sp. EGI L300058]MDN4481768.1 NUDIX hydrolase [Demequina sp. EGI L300058]
MTGDRASEATPRPVQRDLNPGDAWVETPTGERYWGRFGAAGVLAFDERRGVLLQHRAEWSHHGGTWGIPGGALHAGESPLDGALREAAEEAGVPRASVRPRCFWLVDRDVWSYTTVVVDVEDPFEPVPGDAESLELRWVAIEDVDDLVLHPAFAQAWPSLRRSLSRRPHLLVDAANVVGSVPDGWWRDRQGAVERLVRRLAALDRAGVAAPALGLEGASWHPRIEVVVEGVARGAAGSGEVALITALGSGDDAIEARARALTAAGATPVVVTSDRALRERATAAGAAVHGATWLLDLLADVDR